MDCASAPVRDFADLGPVTIPWTARYRLRSEIVGQDYQIDVAWPPVAPRDAERLPVVLVLDGNHALPAAVQAARALQAGPFPMAPTLVVGVGYHFERPEDQARWGRLRVRDFTPCRDALFESQYPSGFACGGAERFLDFLDDELTPFLAERLPIDPDDRTLVGASLGGLLALYALLTRPEGFRRCVAVSPAIYWGDGKLFELEAAFAARAADLQASLFLSAGGLEEGHDLRQGFVSNLYRLEAALRARGWPGLDLALKVFEGENHMSVFPGAVARGLGHVFGGYPDMQDWSRALAR
jgi:predicted alpha/beta superfamily hydrolase